MSLENNDLENFLKSENYRLSDEVRDAIKIAIEKTNMELSNEDVTDKHIVEYLKKQNTNHKGNIIKEIQETDIFAEINEANTKNELQKNKKVSLWERFVSLF